MEKIMLKIKSIYFKNYEMLIKNALEKQKQIENVEISHTLDNAYTYITFDDHKFGKIKLKSVIKVI